MKQHHDFAEASLSVTAPTVSIITPCFNAEHTLKKTVDSVLAQSFQEWELLLIDDRSTDNTYDVAQKLARTDSRIQVLQLANNGGAAKARNHGIEHATGQFIAFIDADDQWETEKLSTQIKWMIEQQCPLSYTAYSRSTPEGALINWVGVPKKINYRELLKTNYIGCSTAIYDSKAIGKVYMPDIRRRQDYGLWLRILKLIPEARGINTPLTDYLVHDQSLSSNKKVSASYNWKIYRQIEGLSLLTSAYYFFQYAIRGILRTKAPGLSTKLGLLHTTDKKIQPKGPPGSSRKA